VSEARDPERAPSTSARRCVVRRAIALPRPHSTSLTASTSAAPALAGPDLGDALDEQRQVVQ